LHLPMFQNNYEELKKIGNVIILIGNKHEYDFDENELKKLICDELVKRNYSEEDINKWFDDI